MKDLYTFDYTKQDALQTYEAIRKGYSAFFDEFKIPYLVAKADSGSIGGDLSHEYHFPTSKGEDNVMSCNSCAYVANEELAKSHGVDGTDNEAEGNRKFYYRLVPGDPSINVVDLGDPAELRPKTRSWYGINLDRNTLFHAILPLNTANADGNNIREAQINPHALRLHFKDIDLKVDDPFKLFAEHIEGLGADSLEEEYALVERIFDYRLPRSLIEEYNNLENRTSDISKWLPTGEQSRRPDLVKIEAGDNCPECRIGSLRVQKAVELGHTFFLGTRYSGPLEATVATPAVRTETSNTDGLISGEIDSTGPGPQPSTSAIQMGCHGIGVSRMIAAVADSLADDKGLNWPRVMAPFEAVVIPAKGFEQDAIQILDLLNTSAPMHPSPPEQEQDEKETPLIDAILDDREKEMAWKLKDADLIGYPVIVVLGRAWRKERRCEVQCRRLNGLKRDVPLGELRETVADLLGQL